MGGSRIFDWGGPRIEKARDARQNVALFALKSWSIGGGHGPVAPPGTIPYDLYPNTVILHWIWLKHLQSHMVNLQTLWCSNRKSTRTGRWSAFILE